jgi:ATP-dependent helicase/DNAse subunit B
LPLPGDWSIITTMTKTLHIFPSAAAVEAFHRSKLEESGVILGVCALTLKRLTEELSRTVSTERRLISNAGRKLLLEETAREYYAAGEGHFASIRGFPGFVGALDSLFNELKQAMVGAEQFAAMARTLPGGGKLAEVAALFGLYNDALSARALMDLHDLEQEALCHLRRGGALPELFVDAGNMEISAIYDLSPLQLALVAEISRRIPVRMHLPYNPEMEPLYASAARTAEAIESLDNSDLMLEPVFAEPSGTFLTPLLNGYRADVDGSGKSAPLPGPMALLSAPGAYRECEEIGRRIRSLLDEGVDPCGVAVLFRDLKSYGPMLEDVCRRFRIPVSYRRGAPLHTAPLVRACLAPFAAVRSKLGREEIISICNSSYIAPPDAGIPPEVVEEVLLKARYMDETLGRVEGVLERRITALRKAGRDTGREEGVRRFLAPLLMELRRFRKEQTLAGFVALLEGFAARYQLFRKGIEAADLRALKRDASAVTLFRQVLDDLESDIVAMGMSEREFSPAAFAELLRDGMEGLCLAGERFAGVSIMTFHDARGLLFDHLFIGGLNEGVTPGRHDSHPLFKDSARLLWRNSAGINPFRTSAEKGLQEPLLFHLAVGCATASLTFSYSYMDSRGNAMIRSPFLDDILARFPLQERRTPVSSITPELPCCLEREELLNTLASRAAFSAAQEPGAASVRDALLRIAANGAIEKMREAFFAAQEGAAQSELSSIYSGLLQRRDIVAELAAFYAAPPGNSFAPTILEEYGSCPFRYFLQRLVGVSPLEKPDLELEARDEGSLVHELLHTLFQTLSNEGLLPVRDLPAARSALHGTAEEVFSRWEAEQYTGEPLLWEINKKKMLHILERMLEMEGEDSSGLVPSLFEHSFSDLEVGDPDGSLIMLKGKIDRTDVDGRGRLRVVDYKLAGDLRKYREMLKKENLGVTSFQMPVYLLAAGRELERTRGGSIDRYSALYWLLARLEPLEVEFSEAKGDDFRGFFSADPEERQDLGSGNFLNRLCGMVRAMKGGDFRISPKDCGFCRLRSVCRYVEMHGGNG